MKKFAPSFIAIAVSVTLYSPITYAQNFISNTDTNKACLIDVPKFNRPLVTGDVNSLPITAESNRFETIYPNTAIYQGDVEISQGNRTVTADKATVETKENKDRILTLDGNIIYKDNMINLDGSSASMNLNSNDIQVENSHYYFVDRLGHGRADEIRFEKNQFVILKNGNYTSCPVNTKSWSIEGTTITHDNKEELLEVWNAVFRIGNVPVFYSPYLQLPTGTKRRSGLLMPNITYNSTDGVNLALPLYWNIAANYDMTLTPRFLQNRGVQIQTESRYLNILGQGTIAFDWLENDALYAKDRASSLDSNNYGSHNNRWLFYWQHDGVLYDNWRFHINYARVSDSQYLNDLDSDFVSETDGYLTQNYKIDYADENWDIGLSYTAFQSFSSIIRDSVYRTEPQLDINYYKYDFGPFSFKTYAQIAHFVSTGESNPDTWRAHIEPSIDYTLSNAWSSLTTEASIMATHYEQNDFNKEYNSGQYENLDKSVNRVLPKLSVDGKLIFERDTTFLDGYSQTLEPRVKYLYIPYRDQSNILTYDSTLLQSDYIGLFRDSPYSGLDRIASANKISAGVTTRLYDKNKTERFNLSAGQVTYLSQAKTSDQSSNLDKDPNTRSMTWALDSFWKVSDNFIFRGGIQHDARINEISLADASLEYRPSSDKLVQLSYRYASKNYIDYIEVLSGLPYKQNISQAGIMFSWPITDTINAVGSYYYDVKLNQPVDGFVGLNYSDCCWGITVQYGRKLTGWESTTQQSQYENRFSVNFELRGFGRSSNATAKMLNYGKLPYTSTF